MRDNYFETHRDPVSKPTAVILDQQNHVVGELLDGFPEDPPSNLQVSFTDWRNDFPRRIDLYQAGVSALDPHPYSSLFWDERQHRYVEGPKLRWDAQRHRYLEGPTLVWGAGLQRYVIKPSLIFDERHRWFVEAPIRAAPVR